MASALALFAEDDKITVPLSSKSDKGTVPLSDYFRHLPDR